jgi:hypothetical protein
MGDGRLQLETRFLPKTGFLDPQQNQQHRDRRFGEN